MNSVLCLAWVAKGIAKLSPDKLQLTPEELKSLVQETKDLSNKIDSNQISKNDEDYDEINENFDDESDEDVDGGIDEDVDEENEMNNQETENVDDKSEEKKSADEDFDSKYNLTSYDDDDDKDQPFINIHDVATFVDNKEDTYITDLDAVEEDEKEDEEDFIIKESDNLLLVGHMEEESSVLEVYVYNKEDDALYVHHDIVLPAYPIALEWLDFHPSDTVNGNFVAVGDMTSIIKVWDLDVVDILEPEYCLGKEFKEKKMEKIKLRYHTKAVLSLSWNKQMRNILASGSADSSIILWDLENAKPANKINCHSKEVQSLQWHPFESSFLLSGDSDGVVKLFDCHIPNSECKSWKLEGEIEKVAWNLFNPMKILCSTDKGFIHCIDMKSNKIEHSIKAHSEGVTALDMCPTKPNILMTASMDKTIKIWDLQKLSHIHTQKLKVGSIYCAKFAPDNELIVAVGGNCRSNNLKVIDLDEKLNSIQEKNSRAANKSIENIVVKNYGLQKHIKNSIKIVNKKPKKFKTSIISEPSTSYQNREKFSKRPIFSSTKSLSLKTDSNNFVVKSRLGTHEVKSKSHIIYSDDDNSETNQMDSKMPPVKKPKKDLLE